MRLTEWYYLPIAALINGIFLYFWQKNIAQKRVTGGLTLGAIFLGSLLNAWGLDVIQRLAEVMQFADMAKVVFGCWLMFVAATSAKYYAINGWSKRLFFIDAVGDLIGFSLMGMVIYYLT